MEPGSLDERVVAAAQPPHRDSPLALASRSWGLSFAAQDASVSDVSSARSNISTPPPQEQ